MHHHTVYAVLGIKLRPLWALDKHSTNGAIFLALVMAKRSMFATKPVALISFDILL